MNARPSYRTKGAFDTRFVSETYREFVLFGLLGVAVLACMGVVVSHAPARLNSEVETKISSALGSGKQYAYVFAHMVNHKSLVDWALQQGANGVEIDLAFSGGNPTKFLHGVPCDCTCKVGTLKNVCTQTAALGPLGTCTHGTGINDMLEHLATKKISAMVYIDSKTDDLTGDKNRAGKAVGNKLIANLFAKGFKGAVIVGSPNTQGVDYLKGVNSVIAASSYKHRVYYTLDMVRDGAGDGAIEAMQQLTKISPYRVYGTGITACDPFLRKYHDEIALAAKNAALGVLSMAPTIWTLDSSSSMQDYLGSGARSIMTNVPADAVAEFKKRRIPLSRVGDFPPPATTSTVSDGLLPDGVRCERNKECKSKACGRKTAASGEKTQCCEHGYTNVGLYDYCTKMPDGAECLSDKMCRGVCKGNFGPKKGKCFTLYSRADGARCSSNDECRSRYCRSGKCFTKKGDWASCPSEQNSECKKGNCNRTTRDGDYKCCPRGTFYCWPRTRGECKSGFYYCKGTLGN